MNAQEMTHEANILPANPSQLLPGEIVGHILCLPKAMPPKRAKLSQTQVESAPSARVSSQISQTLIFISTPKRKQG